jgi:argininosuccinate lyase
MIWSTNSQSGKTLDFDDRLAKYDVLGSIAHAKMLAEVGLIRLDEEQAIVAVLEEVLSKSKKEASKSIKRQKISIHKSKRFSSKTWRNRKENPHRKVKKRPGFDGYQIIFIRRNPRNHRTDGFVFQILKDKANQHKNVLLPGYTFSGGDAFVFWIVVWSVCRISGGRFGIVVCNEEYH